MNSGSNAGTLNKVGVQVLLTAPSGYPRFTEPQVPMQLGLCLSIITVWVRL